jgi:hypothetical protein
VWGACPEGFAAYDATTNQSWQPGANTPHYSCEQPMSGR